MTRPDIRIFVVPQTLSDGSRVFDVKFGGVTLNAVDEDAATWLANAICAAIAEHANNTPEVIYSEERAA